MPPYRIIAHGNRISDDSQIQRIWYAIVAIAPRWSAFHRSARCCFADNTANNPKICHGAVIHEIDECSVCTKISSFHTKCRDKRTPLCPVLFHRQIGFVRYVSSAFVWCIANNAPCEKQPFYRSFARLHPVPLSNTQFITLRPNTTGRRLRDDLLCCSR